MTVKLSLASLKDAAATAGVPNYDPKGLTPGIIHFGVGNFHRAHQAVYLDDLFNTGKGHDWALIGAGVLPSDAAMRDKLKAQDYLTTVVEQDNNKTGARVTAPMIDIIVEDGKNPAAPKTVFGLILAGLKLRRERGVQPFTIMSCDNIPGNGHVTENTVIGLAKMSDPAFADWIHENVAFPNSMVDRITPATGQREVDILKNDFNIDDNWPVFCEEFKQWVMEDNFPAGRPALEEVGVQFVSDVAPYELMKIRILNGGHATIAYPGELLDIHFVHESMEHPLIRAFLAKLEKEEIIPIVPPVPDTNLDEYFDLIERRFLNPKIGDTIPRLAQDGSNRQPKFILPSTRDRLAQGKDIVGLSLVSALWCRYFAGTSDSGRKIVFNDASAEKLQAAAIKAKDDPAAFLVFDEIFGEVSGNELFRKRFAHALKTLWSEGTAKTLQLYLDDKLVQE